MADRLEDLLRSSTVRVRGGSMAGAGFFVAPGRVMTCAHLIGGDDTGSLVVQWDRDRHHPVEFPVSGPPLILPSRGRPIPALEADYPDVAVLEVRGIADHPCVLLDPGWPEVEDRFLVFGYPTEGGAQLMTPARLTYRGSPGTAPTMYLDLGSDTIKPGMSGAALLNLRTGAVCGVVVASKHVSQAAGALAVPWAEISVDLDDVTTANQAFHNADQRWNQAQRQAGNLPLPFVPSSNGPEVTARPQRTAVPGYTAVNEALPDALGETFADGNVLLVAGPEIPEARRGPGRMRLLRRLVEQTYDESIGAAGREQILASLDMGNLDPASRLLRVRQDRLEAMVTQTYAAPSADSAYDALAQIAFTGVINMSWDSLLLDAFRARSPVVIRDSSKEVLAVAKSKEFAFIWFVGDPKHEQIAISSGEVRARLFANETLSRFLTGSVQSSSLLFVGVRASDIIDFFDALGLGGLGISPAITTQRRYAVCAIDELWELNRSQLRDSFGVELIGYDPADRNALARIIQRLQHVSRLHTAGSGMPVQPRTQVLRRVTLTNIGTFERLDLELGESWNLLLGINGCGKTTLLRAVALGLCGDHPFAVEAGDGLLRTGCDQGLIELQVGTSRFRTELQRMVGSEVRVRANSLSPLEQGSWVVLGFPALWGMPLIAPSGISHTQAPKPRVEDLPNGTLTGLSDKGKISRIVFNLDEDGLRGQRELEWFEAQLEAIMEVKRLRNAGTPREQAVRDVRARYAEACPAGREYAAVYRAAIEHQCDQLLEQPSVLTGSGEALPA
jgi:Trypsin-like peptidase domain/AAA domain